jgi:hypothetical protein
MGRFFTHVSLPHRLQNFSPLNDSDQYHNDCDDEQNMNESSHRITAHQPQQPQNYQYHSDCPKHSNPLLLHEALPHVHAFNPAAYPFPKGRRFNSPTVQAPTSSIAVRSQYPRNQQRGELLCNERPTEKVALPFFAMLRLQEGQLRLFLHAFGDTRCLRLVPMAIMALTMMPLPFVEPMAWTNDPSILRVSIGN